MAYPMLSESAVSAAEPMQVVNRLIQRLAPRERTRVLQGCQTVELGSGAILCEPDQAFRHVYFPLTCFISLVEPVSGHEPLEMGMIGNEGMLGVTLTLGIDAVPQRAVVRGGGTALRMTAGQFRRALRDHPSLLRTLNRYLYVLMAQLSQTAACTCFHNVGARLARCLLLTHDRAHADHFHLTHHFLGGMLGVQRSAVTIAARELQHGKLIRYSRGQISILDRKGLEAVSCECYGEAIDDYARRLAL
jgi:CRP-like cAMP-binding protein